jgi:hypothetical protein
MGNLSAQIDWITITTWGVSGFLYIFLMTLVDLVLLLVSGQVEISNKKEFYSG